MLGLFLGVAAAYAEDVVTEPILTFTGHTGYVPGVAYSPDGTKVLTGSHDGTAKLWDAETGDCIGTFIGHTSNVNSVAYSPDGTKVLTGSSDKTAKLWDASTGSVIRTFSGHTSSVWSVAYSPDGTTVLTGGDDYAPRLWDASTGGQIRTFTGHTSVVHAVAFSPDGTKVLTGSYDNTARLWDAATGAHIRTFSGHTSRVESVAYSPDGTKVLTGTSDGIARLFEADTGTVIRTLIPYTEGNRYVFALAFSHDGKYVLTGSYDGGTRIWDAATGELLRMFQGQEEPYRNNEVHSLAFSPDGTRILASNGSAADLWKAGPELCVSSIPLAGVSIEGDAPGETSFSRIFTEASQTVTLTAPPIALSGAARYDFVRWEIDGEQQPQGETTVEFTVDASMTATAVYQIRTHTLTVVSEPFGGLDIIADDPGNTPYSASGTDQEAVHLALDWPFNMMHGGSSYNFLYWLIDGVPQPRGCTSVDILMDADRTATAVYNLFADANGDCAVNVLDLIFVRNRLGLNPNTGDNWRADVVDGDMAINVVDLIAVRNYLGTRCAE